MKELHERCRALESAIAKPLRKPIRHGFRRIAAEDPVPEALARFARAVQRSVDPVKASALTGWNRGTKLKAQCAKLQHAAQKGLAPLANLLSKDSVAKRRPLRHAFDKISHVPPPTVRRAVDAMARAIRHPQSRALALWRLAALQGRKDRQIASLGKMPRVVDGVQRLDNAIRRTPKQAIRALQR
jgi:hypothetical protein